MDEELEKEIERKKRELSDYLRLSEILKLDEEMINKRIDLMLDDLRRLLKKRK